MDKVCDYCGAKYEETLETCPHCGAANDYVRRANGVPRTIEELKQYYIDHKFPDKEITRFFIDEDYRGARAFGIYKDGNGDFVVYKNKPDGTRAIRYQGSDESYAVNEIYLKLKEELSSQDARRATNGTSKKGKKPDKRTIIIIAIVAFMVISTLISILGNSNKYNNGYYDIDGVEYYCYNDDWYAYGSGGWYSTGSPDIENGDYSDYSDYYSGNNYSANDYYSDWDDSPYYDDYNNDVNNDNDWDNDYDGGGWDSGGDWDSDWFIHLMMIFMSFKF